LLAGFVINNKEVMVSKKKSFVFIIGFVCFSYEFILSYFKLFNFLKSFQPQTSLQVFLYKLFQLIS